MKYEVVEDSFIILADSIKSYFNNINNITLFQKRNTLKIIEYEKKKYVVKSFKIPHILNKIVYRFFRDSKAKRSYANSLRLIELGINTPNPIGYIEFNSILFFKESFYISEFFDYNFEIRAVLKDKNFEDRENILKKFIEFSYELHNKGVYHVDYSPGNILIQKHDKGYVFSIIDVNRMKFVKFDDTLRMKSLMKLTNSKADNKFMAEYYAKISGKDKYLLFDILQLHLKEQQKYLDNKKRLKSMKG